MGRHIGTENLRHKRTLLKERDDTLFSEYVGRFCFLYLFCFISVQDPSYSSRNVFQTRFLNANDIQKLKKIKH